MQEKYPKNKGKCPIIEISLPLIEILLYFYTDYELPLIALITPPNHPNK